MQQNTPLTINAAALFFVGSSDDVEQENNVPINVPFRIGRNPDVDLCLQCASVSGLHAEIIEVNGQFWLCDLNSTNGTFLNGRRVQGKSPIDEEDTVQFGTSVFQIARSPEADSRIISSPEREADCANLQNDRFERLFHDGVVPFFQPVLRIDQGAQSVTGYEVLGRSRLFGLRTPAQMFAAASRLEMEAELSRVLRKKGIEVADQNLAPDYTLFVNTHPAELECEGLDESLFEIRDSHPTRPIMLEVHESILNEPQKFSKLRATLQNLDIQIAFHDFGAGQIRLAELCELAPNVVKFDVQLVRGIDKANSKRQQFVASMVRMLTDMGITPMAECVEQPGECESLKQLGFQLGQGFLFGRPSSISDCVDANSVKRTEPVPQVKSFIGGISDVEDSTFESKACVAQQRSKDGDWLLTQPGHHYTIQVLSAISEERAKKHISMQLNPDQFAIFCKQGKTRMLYIVVHGVFEDRAAAKAAAAQLANASVSPWIRMLSSVHAEIQAK